MAVASGYGKTTTSGSVFMYDTGDTYNSYIGEPTTNVFTHYGTSGPGSVSDNAVNFSNQGTTGFVRLGYGQTFGGYTIKPTDVVYKYPLGGYGCHYHGNSAAIGSGKYATFTFDYYVSPGTTIENTYLANLENYGGSALGGGVVAPNSLTGVWQTVTFTLGPTGGSGTQAMFLYPGGCGPRFGDSGYILYKNPQVEFLPHKTPFVQTTRSATQGLLPLVGNSSIDLSNVSFDSSAQVIWDGTNDYIEIPFETILNDCTIEVIFRATSTSYYQYPLAIRNNSVGSSYAFYLDMNDPDGSGFAQTMWAYWNSGGTPYSVVPKTGTYGDWNDSTYRHYVFTRSTSVAPYTLHYMNGNLVGNVSRAGDQTTQFGNGAGYKLYLGSINGGGGFFSGNLPVVKIYNRTLSAAEVKQNYNKYKSRFNLS
jgi:hypothetical protein